MAQTLVKLIAGSEPQVFEHVAAINLAPGFVILQNPNKDPIAIFNSNLVESIKQPAHDTDITLNSKLLTH